MCLTEVQQSNSSSSQQGFLLNKHKGRKAALHYGKITVLVWVRTVAAGWCVWTRLRVPEAFILN